jgi:hypothetical protein
MGSPPPPGPPGPSGNKSPEQAKQVAMKAPSFVVIIQGRRFQSVPGAFQYIRSLTDTAQRYHAVNELATQMLRASGMMEDWFEIVWTEVEQLKKDTSDWKNPAFKKKWEQIAAKAKQVRKKRDQEREAVIFLCDKRHWCTQEFHDTVLTPFLTGNSGDRLTRTMYDAIKKAYRQNIGPIETLQRTTERIIRRLEGKENWNDGELHATPSDVLEGLKIENMGDLDQGRMSALGRKTLFWDQQYSIVWEKGVPASSRKALAEQEKWGAGGKIEDVEQESPRSVRSPSVRSTQAPEVSQKRARPMISYSGMEGSSKTWVSAKRQKEGPGQYSVTPDEQSIEELSDVLQGLAVVGQEKLGKVEDSGLKTTISHIRNPIQKPNQMEKALWDLTISKVKGIATNQPVSVARNVAQVISSTSSEGILKAVTSIARGLARSGLDDTNAAAYIQSSVDTGNLFLRGVTEQSVTINEIRLVTRN